MTGYQVYKRFMRGESLDAIGWDAEYLMRQYLWRRDARRKKK